MVSTGHYMATTAGYRILEQGGNATDAGVAAGIALNMVLPQTTSFGGVAPIIIHNARDNETVTISGLGRWPKAANIDYFIQHTNGDLPTGVLRTVTPAAADAWLTALKLYGTMTFEQVVTPALKLLTQVFPVPAMLHRTVRPLAAQRFFIKNALLAPVVARLAESRFPIPAELHRELVVLSMRRNLARTFRRLIKVEQANAARGRAQGIQAARDFFYQGEIANEMVSFCQEQGGLLTMEDLADFQVKIEPPAIGSYKGIDVYTCGHWCQGPVTIETLHILEGHDLKGMGHNSADYLHTLIEALKLAFADREAYYGDPDFVEVPLDGLLSKAYAADRRGAMDGLRACPEMPHAGDPWPYQGGKRPPGEVSRPEPMTGSLESDTSYACVVDRWGNAFSATPSDGLSNASPARGLGFVISDRGSQSWLDPDHPSSLAPGKRPRLTTSPSLAFRNGKVWMPFGGPGGDVQCQSMVQFFLNVVEFGMNLQEAAEAPRVSTWSFPGSFWPHAYHPGLVGVEGRIDPQTVADLKRRGHQVEVWDDWTRRQGSLCAIGVDQEHGGLTAGVDPRHQGYAMGR